MKIALRVGSLLKNIMIQIKKCYDNNIYYLLLFNANIFHRFYFLFA